MRSLMLLGLVAIVGCGASQAAPTAAPAKAIAAPTESIIASAPAEAASTAAAALAVVPGSPRGWTVTITAASGPMAGLAGQTFTVPCTAGTPHSVMGHLQGAAYVGINVIHDSRNYMTTQPEPQNNMSILAVGIPNSDVAGNFIRPASMSFSGTGQVLLRGQPTGHTFSASATVIP